MTHNIEYLNWTFTPDKIREGNLYLVTSLLSSALEVNTLFAAVECLDPSILDFERNAPLLYYTSPNLPMIFRVQNIKRVGPGIYEISATSTLGLLTEGLHYGGIYTGQTAQEVVSSICGTVPFIIKNNLAGTKLYGWLPIAAPRDNLSQVLFAIGAALKTDLDGVLRIAGLWDGVSGTVGRDELYQEARAEYAAKVTQVLLTEHQYAEGAEAAKLFEGTAQEGDIVTFREPMHSLTAEGFSVLESGANYAKVSAGSGTLTGKKYIHNTRLISRNVQTANAPNIKAVDKATLVSLVNSAAVADRLAAFYKCTQTIDAPVVYSGENPGDVLSVYHPYDKSAVSSCLQSADITLSGTLKAQEKSLVGFEPLQSIEAVYYDHVDIITEDTEFTIPEGVKSVHAVLIGGGSGGQAGTNGTSGTSGTSGTIYAGGSGRSTGTKGTGGEGGAAGVGGIGGKIIQLDIDISDCNVMSITIGTGGLGGESNGAEGAAGTDTTITLGDETYSSGDGSSSPAGYNDLTTGNIYASPGQSGKAGGPGGSGGTYGTSAQKGGDVSSWAGGAVGSSSYREGSNSVVEKNPPTVSQSWGSTTSRGETMGGTIGDREFQSGYPSYNLSTDGFLSSSGSTRIIGKSLSTSNGGIYDKPIEGTVYSDFSNGSAPSSGNGTTYSRLKRSVATQTRTGTSTLGTTYYYVIRDTTLSVKRVYTATTYKDKWLTGTYPGGGGGAAWGASGSDASTAGGKGADATPQTDATIYGNGGNGGNGGGGGGGGGAGEAQVSGDTNKVQKSYTGYGAYGGSGGTGSAGSRGANGCVILYYGVPKKTQSGQLVDKNNRMVLDRLGRRIIV